VNVCIVYFLLLLCSYHINNKSGTSILSKSDEYLTTKRLLNEKLTDPYQVCVIRFAPLLY